MRPLGGTIGIDDLKPPLTGYTCPGVYKLGGRVSRRQKPGEHILFWSPRSERAVVDMLADRRWQDQRSLVTPCVAEKYSSPYFSCDAGGVLSVDDERMPFACIVATLQDTLSFLMKKCSGSVSRCLLYLAHRIWSVRVSKVTTQFPQDALGRTGFQEKHPLTACWSHIPGKM